ncbi:MAG: hypothetical protein IJG37_11160, partial [Synergistaceae bacterium]|nr:hypothetical protein [Synergistaceae bacterium]
AATDGKSATVTYTVPKNALVSTDEAKTDTVQVVVTNTYTKEYGSFDVKITINPPSTALPAAKDALPEDRLDADDEALSDDLEAEEGAVTYGGARTIEALTADQRRVLAEGGYIIAAILPEIRAEESGQYDLEAVSLDEAAPEGYELVWFAFPVDVESSDDDLIAEFYDEAGAEVFAVPEGRVVVPSPWLEAEITYAPVIAVKAPAAGDAKDSLENAEEGDTVTEKALEEAGEKPADEDEAPVIELTAEDKSE